LKNKILYSIFFYLISINNFAQEIKIIEIRRAASSTQDQEKFPGANILLSSDKEKVKLINGELNNNKITYMDDVKIPKTYFGIGFDLHRLIKKLKNTGLGYRKISKVLNQHNVKTINGKSFYPSLIFGILKKIKVKQELMNKRVVKEYMDFDIVFVEKV